MNNNSRSRDDYVAVSRLLSKILRHEREMVGIRLDNHGWVLVDELISNVARDAERRHREETLPAKVSADFPKDVPLHCCQGRSQSSLGG